MLVFTCQFCNELCSEIQWHQSLIRSIISLVHAITLPNDKVNGKKKRKCVYDITDSEKLLIYSPLNEKTTGPGGLQIGFMEVNELTDFEIVKRR